ncbi:hypothetical protein [Deinococcus apachensis]|uniref:hypothetical protein n=1 Tax=Deinococcus apachensis TaxID=309886 RepID=UPI000374B493|nr:hypothetical protein [Deinococcus apachensis]
MNELLQLLTGMLGGKAGFSAQAVLKLAPILAPIVADLRDGDAHLSQENRLKVQEALDDLERGELI